MSLLKLPSLELRRLRFDVIYCYRIIFGLVDINCDNFFEIRSCTVIEATLIRFLTIIAQVQPDPRFSLSVLLIFGMVCHLIIQIFHR